MTQSTPCCPVCGSNEISFMDVSDTIERDGLAFKVTGITESLCRTCGTDFTSEEQMRANQRIVNRAWKIAKGLLTGDQVAAIRQNLGFSKAQMGQLLGGGVNAFSRYETEAGVQSTSMDEALRAYNANPSFAASRANDKGIKARSQTQYFTTSLKLKTADAIRHAGDHWILEIKREILHVKSDKTGWTIAHAYETEAKATAPQRKSTFVAGKPVTLQ